MKITGVRLYPISLPPNRLRYFDQSNEENTNNDFSFTTPFLSLPIARPQQSKTPYPDDASK
jgi:hypothetical protein